MRTAVISLLFVVSLAGLGWMIWQFNLQHSKGMASEGYVPIDCRVIEWSGADPSNISTLKNYLSTLDLTDRELLLQLVSDSTDASPWRICLEAGGQWLLITKSAPGMSAERTCEYQSSTQSCGDCPVCFHQTGQEFVSGNWISGMNMLLDGKKESLRILEWKNNVQSGVKVDIDQDEAALLLPYQPSVILSPEGSMNLDASGHLRCEFTSQISISGGSDLDPELFDLIPSDADSFLVISSPFAENSVLREDHQTVMNLMAELEAQCDCDALSALMNPVTTISLASAKSENYLIVQFSQEIPAEVLENLVTNFDQYKAYPILTSDLAGYYLGMVSTSFNRALPQMTITSNALVFAESQNAMFRYINALSSGNTLRSSESFSSYSNACWKSAALLGYWRSPESTTLDWYFSSSDTPLLAQVASINENTAVELFAAGEESELEALEEEVWEFHADENLRSRPWVVRNHNSGGRDILFQDQNHALYQISAKGERQWKKELEGPIIGAPKQVDAFRNGKLQLVFSTRNKIFMLDRNGKDVDGFPVKLSGPAATEVKVFDYDSNRDYRFLIGMESGEILNFNRSGNAQKGWKFAGGGAAIEGLEHIRIKDKDYILALSGNGKIHLLKRNGKSRYEPKATADHYGGQGYFLLEGKAIGESKLVYPDSLGNVVVVQLDQPVSEFGLTGFSSGSKLAMRDFDGDGEEDYIIIDGSELKIYNQNNDRLLRFDASADIIGEASVYNFGGGVRMIGFSTSADEMYLVNLKGKVQSGFPKKGSSQYAISDLDRNGTFEAVVSSSYGSVICYHVGKVR